MHGCEGPTEAPPPAPHGMAPNAVVTLHVPLTELSERWCVNPWRRGLQYVGRSMLGGCQAAPLLSGRVDHGVNI